VGARLGLAFALVLALLLGVTGSALYQASKLQENAEYYDWNITPSLKVVHLTAQAVDDSRRFESQHIMLDTASELQDLETRVMASRKTANEKIAAYKDLVSDPTDQKNYDDVKAATEGYFATQDRLLAISRNSLTDKSQREVAKKLLFGESREKYQRVADAGDKWWDYNVTLAGEMTTQGRATYRKSIWMLCGLSLIALAAGAVAALRITRSITRPIAGALNLAQSVAAGDLTARITVESHDEVGQLAEALNGMSESLAALIGDVRKSVDAIATSSTEIAHGNSDLSARTEQQASSLEETAASMEQMAGTLRSSADSARQASQLASSTSEIAAQGGAAVAQVVATMGEIQQSSHRIADIISVIDGIAFQTNILALNAAVEAARAGEQGRGFAVVATEVRSLAQRSAGAAREIKALIGDSVARVESGNQVVTRAGATITEVVTQVQRVADIIAEVTSSSNEQSQGVEQVNQAVTALDQATQQNAALVEQTAAATASLRAQAQNLAMAVSTFKV
jgi:methyl-accepting chemotaxis protein